jgi:hypothetical protein
MMMMLLLLPEAATHSFHSLPLLGRLLAQN